MKKRSYFISRMECQNCGGITTVSRRNNKRRKKHHIKTMYCPFCHTETDFVELDDFEDRYGGVLDEKAL